jgi:hypothetical protein
MNGLWQVGYITAIILGVAYISLPSKIHRFGFEFLRRSSANQSDTSGTPVWLYRGLGVMFLFIGVTGVL